MKIKEEVMKPLIHGENIFKPVKALPKGKVSKHKLFVVGHSETGHHHVVESKTAFDVIQEFNNLFIEFKEEAKLFHKKSHDIHETLTVKPGTYQIFRAKEYDPFQKIMREVWD